MTRLRGDVMSPHYILLLAATAGLLTISSAGPLPNVTVTDIGSKEGSCALGDVVYMPGDEFPGTTPCERCKCARGGVSCARQVCEPRPGCKALHRPDHCCPTYQCECEQEGRVYGNGEKLVDPQDPCRVCYCQGGEVVCRRIACFLRDDCRPRHVPGRCCPEYENCPLRGVTAIPGLSATLSAIAAVEDVGTSPEPVKPKEVVKQQITIKEITPVSEIPVITDVKIKEILPSSSINIAEYPSSKAPLITREATSEKTNADVTPRTEQPTVVEIIPSSTPVHVTSTLYAVASTKLNSVSSEIKPTGESLSSKNLAPQEIPKSETSGLYVPSTARTQPPTTHTPQVVHVTSSTKAPIMEEEDPSLFEHNPAFPPLPDDFSVLSNHEDENIDSEHIPTSQDIVKITTSAQPTEVAAFSINSIASSTSSSAPDTTAASISISTTKLEETSNIVRTSVKIDIPKTTEASVLKESPMLNLRAAIPTEILNVPSLLPEDITGELDEVTEIPPTTATPTEKVITYASTVPEEIKTTVNPVTKTNIEPIISTVKTIELTQVSATTENVENTKTSSETQPSLSTDVTSQTELSSLPVETSDQNPQESLINMAKEQKMSSSTESKREEYTTKPVQYTPERISTTVLAPSPPTAELTSFENAETTEFVLSSFGSSESTTDGVELIKISSGTQKSAPFIKPTQQTRNVFKDIISLVGDVATINDHTEEPETLQKLPAISDSEELLPVNAGYKSKNSNWNINSITEMPSKSKTAVGNKQKVIEIEGEDTDSITDSPPPNDKAEPTTRRPVIDNVSDDIPKNKTDRKDIEIISQSYVPTISKRPSKVVLKKTLVGHTTSEPSMATNASATPEPATTAAPAATAPVSLAPAATFPPSTSAPSPATSPPTSALYKESKLASPQ